MKQYDTSYTTWQKQVEKELRGKKSFEEFINVNWFEKSLKRYYTAEEHKTISDFSKKISFANQGKTDVEFRNYCQSNGDVLSKLQEGAYNGIYFDSKEDLNDLDASVDLGFLKSICNSKIELDENELELFKAKGDHNQTLVVNESHDLNHFPFVAKGTYYTLSWAQKGLNIDTELALALFEAEQLLESVNPAQVHFLISLGWENWLEASSKLRTLQYLWMSLLSEKGFEPQKASATIISNPHYLDEQDGYNYLLRQNIHAFLAQSNQYEGIVIPPFNQEKVGEHSSGRISQLIEHESDIPKDGDPLEGNYILDFACHYLADAAWNKFLKLKETNNANDLLDAFLREDLKELELKDKKFVGLNVFPPEGRNEKQLNFGKTQDEPLSFK